MLLAVKALKKNKLLIDQSDGGTTKEAIENFFNDENYEEITDIPPTEMTTRFTEEEKAINKLKNGKSVGSNKIKAEQLKYGPKEVTSTICELMN